MVNYVLLLFPSEPNSPERLVGRLLIFSGKTGEVLRWVRTPDERETYFSPVIYTKKDSTELVLFGTGGSGTVSWLQSSKTKKSTPPIRNMAAVQPSNKLYHILFVVTEVA